MRPAEDERGSPRRERRAGGMGRWVATFALGFGAVLLYLSAGLVPGSPPAGLEPDARAAEEACQRAVGQRIAGARFPFAAHVTHASTGEYQLRGVVDATRADESVRRNYECDARRAASGDYRVDSLRVWQSH